MTSFIPIVVGTSMEDVGRGPFRPDNLREEADFFSVHPYSIYAPKLFPDAMLSERGTYGSAFETALSGGAGKPVMVQEIGASSAQYDPEADRESFCARAFTPGSERVPTDFLSGATPMPRRSSSTKCHICALRMKPNSA